MLVMKNHSPELKEKARKVCFQKKKTRSDSRTRLKYTKTDEKKEKSLLH